MWLRLALIFIGAYLGLFIKNTETASSLFAVAFPLGFISSVFTPPEMMPGWLGTIAAWILVSSTAGAIRELFHTPGIDRTASTYRIDGHDIAGAILRPIALRSIFLPLAVAPWQRLGR